MEESRPFFSIIVPVYNVEQYLAECLESVLAQSCKDYEAILVDDGATDRSGEICDRYAGEHSCFTVIHQKNRGLSAARNAGIRRAKGEYIVLLDSDDLLTQGALEAFSRAVSETHGDIYAGNVLRWENGEKLPLFDGRRGMDSPLPGREFMEQALLRRAFSAPAQFNVYRREFLLRHALFFKEGILHEDEWWTPQVFLKAETAVNLDFLFYIYRIRPGSIMTSRKPRTQNGLDLLDTCRDLDKLADLYPASQVCHLRDRLAMLYMNAVFVGELAGRKEAALDRKFPLRNAGTVKNRLKALLFWLSPGLYCRIDKQLKTR